MTNPLDPAPPPPVAPNPLRGLAPANLPDEYRRRGLDALSDAQLCHQAAAIIADPVKSWSSFILHAPLELMARGGLLPLVDPSQRDLARMQLAASAAGYEAGGAGGAGGPIAPPPATIAAFHNPADGVAEFTRTFHAGDAVGLEAIVLQFAAQFGVAALVDLLAPQALPTLSGAAHTHIGLWLLLRHGRNSDVADAALLRAAVRALAGGSKSRLKSFDGLSIAGDRPLDQSPADVEREVLAKLAAPTRAKNAYGSMQATIMAGEATGNPDALFADFLRHDLTHQQIDAAFRAALRACAHNMLQHDTQFAAFGWSHCLTLPQAACGLSSFGIDRKRALAATLVWSTTYRSVISDRDLDLAWAPAPLAGSPGSPSLIEALQTSPTAAASRVWHAHPAEVPTVRQTLATQASIRSDQHLIKYTRACLDMAWFDPQHERLYLAAAAHLCGYWFQQQPDTAMREELFKRVL